MHAGLVRLAVAIGNTPPLIVVALGLIAGDALAAADDWVVSWSPAAIFAVFALVTPLALLSRWLPRLAPLLGRALLGSLAAAYGYIAADLIYRPVFPANHIAVLARRLPMRVEGIVGADAGGRNERTQLLLLVTRIELDGAWREAQGRARVSVRWSVKKWRAGDRIRLRTKLRRPRQFGNPGEFDYVAHLARRGIYSTGFVEHDRDLELLGHFESPPFSWLNRWRRQVAARFEADLSSTDAAVLSALIVGMDAGLPRTLRQAFSRAGVSHVLSISGLHVGLVAAAGYGAFRWLLARSRRLLLQLNVPKLAVGVSVLPVLLYSGIAGTNVAMVRSVIMIVVVLGAVLVDRQRHLLVSLAVAAICILVSAPGAALDISFQLSFVAVLGLVVANERFANWWNVWAEARLLRLRPPWRARLYRAVALYAVASLSALAATSPLTALHFNQVSLIAPLANALVVPLLGSLAVILGLLAALACPLYEPAARLCTLLAGACVHVGVWLVELFASVPGAAVRIVTPSPVELMLLYAALLAAVALNGRRRQSCLITLGLLTLADGTWWFVERYHHRDLRLTFLSVGQGDCAVVEIPGGEVMIIDGGGIGDGSFDVGERLIAPYLWSRKIARVDYVVVSHPQWDHYGGLIFVVQQFAPRQIWSSGATSTAQHYAELQRAIDASGVERVRLQQGDTRTLGGVEVTVNSPPTAAAGWSVNDRSLVLALVYGGERILFTGDVESGAEQALVATYGATLRSTILKVPHHGSQTSSSERFVQAVRPEVAVLSLGFDNRFHFPHPEVLRRYTELGGSVWRTDLDGAVRVAIQIDADAAARVSAWNARVH